MSDPLPYNLPYRLRTFDREVRLIHMDSAESLVSFQNTLFERLNLKDFGSVDVLNRDGNFVMTGKKFEDGRFALWFSWTGHGEPVPFVGPLTELENWIKVLFTLKDPAYDVASR